MLSLLARRAVRSAASLAAGLALLAGSVAAAAAQATVDVGSPSGALSTAHTSATFPVTISRVDNTPVLGFSVEFTLSGNLSLEAGQSSIALGGFLSASGATPSLQIRDLGNGQYGADGVTLGAPCGSDAANGTLFTITVASTDPGSTGTITIDNVTLRDCDNATLPSAIGSAGSVTIDNTLPVVSVTSPNGGESWVGGTEQTLAWSATDESGFGSNAIDIEWSSNGGSSWSPIATGVSNSGSLAWTPPSTPTHTALVRVTARDAYDNATTDESNVVFTILGTTTTSVMSAVNPSVVGESVTLTATVSPAASGGVEFFDGVTSLGTQPVTAGSAALVTSALALGSHSITAVYSGDADYSGSTSAAHSHAVNAAATATSVGSAPNPSVVGESVTLTASVAASPPGSGTPTGSVEFFDGVTSLGSQPLSGGSALLVTSGLPLGSRSITAVYLGSSNYSGSTSAAYSHAVNAAGTTTSVTSAPNPSTFGQGVTLTASVAANPPGSGTPTGSVEFFDGVTSLGSQPLSGGSAQLITSALAPGSRSITAVYLGSANYTGSTSAVHSHIVNAAGASVSLLATPDPGVFQSPETLTATLTPAGATGSVEFFDGSTSLGSSPVSAASAVLLTSSLVVGVHSLRADYLGDSNYSPASSSVVALEVKARITATAGAHGQISPLGDVFVSLNDTPSFTLTADPGYHVSAVTVDALPVSLTSPYTFAPVSSNHTIDVQFAANPAVPAITTLTASTETSGNGPSGIQRIRLDWSAVPAGSTVEVWRAPFGNYPEYNDAPGAGSTPAAPSYPPPAPWAVSTVTASGTADVPPSRDFYYYVAFVTDSYGTRSPVSNVSNGALAYALGDVSDGVTAGQGDNLVDVADISLLGSVYGRVLTPGDAYAYLDVGPTTDYSVHSRPTTDNRVNFEDLVLFGVNFGLVSAPAAAARPAARERDELRLEAPASVTPGTEVAARLTLLGSGTVHGLSVQLSWDPSVVEPVGHSAGEGLLQHHGVLMSPEPGTVDMVVLGAESPGLTGSVPVASVQFRVLRAGDPAIRVRGLDARDVLNRPVQVQGAVASVGGPLTVARFAPPSPMPFHDRTSLVFSLSTRGDVELAVFSVDGRLVRTLASGSHEAGEYRLEWDGRDDHGRTMPSGAYFARLLTAQGRFTRRLTYIR
jgi:hypothetical protein